MITSTYTSFVNADITLSTIQGCVDAGQVILKKHFTARMTLRGLFWGDVLSVIDHPATIRMDGTDEFGRARCFISGLTPQDVEIELLCVIDEIEPAAVFVTIYWKD